MCRIHASCEYLLSQHLKIPYRVSSKIITTDIVLFIKNNLWLDFYFIFSLAKLQAQLLQYPPLPLQNWLKLLLPLSFDFIFLWWLIYMLLLRRGGVFFSFPNWYFIVLNRRELVIPHNITIMTSRIPSYDQDIGMTK